MGKIQDFRELIVWQKAHQLLLNVVKAEGFGRRKGKEYIHYLIVARGIAISS